MIPFGTTKKGEAVVAFEIAEGPLKVRVLSYGAILNSVTLDGVDHDLTVGFDTLEAYETDYPYHGTLIGPVANRLSDAQAPIAGTQHSFDANQDGQHSLHSGGAYTGSKVWTLVDHGPTYVTLVLALPDGEGGFPGNREITAKYRVLPAGTLELALSATTDAPTLMNLANHSYWTMDNGATFDTQTLQIDAAHYLPITSETIPTGEIAPVEGTAYDFRQARRLTPAHPPLDTNFCLSTQDQSLRQVAHLRGESGLSMTMSTTAVGLQIYDDRPNYHALAIEAQGWPDAPNHPGFPSVELTDGQLFQQKNHWTFRHT